MKNPNICFVVATDITLKFLLLDQLLFFKNKGYRVQVVCSPGKWLAEIKKEGIAVKEIAISRRIFSPLKDLVSLARLYFYFRQEKFDVVCTFTPKPGLLGQIAARLAGVPVVANTIFGFYFHEHTPPLQKTFFIFIEKIAATCSSFMFFRNSEDFQTARQERIGRPESMQYIGDGINIVKFSAARFSPEFVVAKKQQVNIDPAALVIGIVARLVKEKGYVELFEAFQKVWQQFPAAMLLIIGHADLQKSDSIKPQQGKNIIFLGERTDVDELMVIMDVFVLPSWREGFPHSIMEASAMSLPVITTDVRGCRAAVEHGKTGIVVPPKNPQKLAQAMVELLSNSPKAKSMGAAGRKKAEREFDEKLMFAAMEEKIHELLFSPKN